MPLQRLFSFLFFFCWSAGPPPLQYLCAQHPPEGAPPTLRTIAVGQCFWLSSKRSVCCNCVVLSSKWTAVALIFICFAITVSYISSVSTCSEFIPSNESVNMLLTRFPYSHSVDLWNIVGCHLPSSQICRARERKKRRLVRGELVWGWMKDRRWLATNHDTS